MHVPLQNDLIQLLILNLLEISDEVLMAIFQGHVFGGESNRRYRLIAVGRNRQMVAAEDSGVVGLMGSLYPNQTARLYPLKRIGILSGAEC